MSAPHASNELSIGYAMACFHSMSFRQSILKQDIGAYPHWYAPGWSGENADQMPNVGHCACGGNFWVTEFYHFFASADGKWHTRRSCNQVVTI